MSISVLFANTVEIYSCPTDQSLDSIVQYDKSAGYENRKMEAFQPAVFTLVMRLRLRTALFFNKDYIKYRYVKVISINSDLVISVLCNSRWNLPNSDSLMTDY